MSVNNYWMKTTSVKGFLLLCRKTELGFCKDTLVETLHWKGKDDM